MSGLRLKPSPVTPLKKAVTITMRVFADTAARWFATLDDSGCEASIGAWTRRGVLVIAANGDYANRIARELERACLIVPQKDKPEHLDPTALSGGEQ